MKKVLILVATLFVGLQANAQLQVDGGYQHFFEQSQITLANSKNIVNSGWDGFYAGARYNIGLPVHGLSIIPGANFSFMFSKEQNVNNANYREIALNIPVDVAYTLNFGIVKVRAFAGPTVQVGLLNHLVSRGGNSSHSYNMYVDNDNPYSLNGRTRLNVSLGFGAAAVVKDSFTAHLRYDLGLVNLTTAQYTKLFRNTLQIGVGYIF